MLRNFYAAGNHLYTQSRSDYLRRHCHHRFIAWTYRIGWTYIWPCSHSESYTFKPILFNHSNSQYANRISVYLFGVFWPGRPSYLGLDINVGIVPTLIFSSILSQSPQLQSMASTRSNGGNSQSFDWCRRASTVRSKSSKFQEKTLSRQQGTKNNLESRIESSDFFRDRLGTDPKNRTIDCDSSTSPQVTQQLAAKTCKNFQSSVQLYADLWYTSDYWSVKHLFLKE